MHPHPLTLLFLLAAAAAPLAAADPVPADGNLLPQGAFEEAAPAGSVPGWTLSAKDGFTVAEGEGKHWLRIENREPARALTATARVAVDPTWAGVAVTARLRVQGLVKGDAVWHTARVAPYFEGPDHKRIGDPLPALQVDQDGDWVQLKKWYSGDRIPANAVSMVLQVGLSNAVGVLEVDDITVVPKP